jgi:MFS family permease
MGAYPSSRHGWSLTLLLTIAYILSYVDRSILGLLIEPIKADIALSDEQMGLLIGPAFALFYATIGLPMGWLADRSRRTWLVAGGVALWSLATAASGLAKGFGHLFLARMGVGVGEAVLSPCAMSMIGDSFPPERRGKPVAVYSTALSLGAGIASLIGAGVLAWAKTSAGLVLPLFGAVSAWQAAFLAVGLPGMILAVPFLLLAEPSRQQTGSPVERKYTAMLGHVGSRWRAFAGLIALVAVMTITAYSHGFMASAFARRFGWQVQDYALANGIMTLVLGPSTVTAIGVLCDRWRAAGRDDAPFRLLSFGFAGMVACGSAALLMPVGWAALAMLGINTMAMGAVTATGIIALLDITPAPIRGQVVAIYYMAISIAGLGLGPTTVGLLSTRLFGEANLHLAVASVPVLFGLVPLIMLRRIGRAYRAEKSAVAALAGHAE